MKSKRLLILENEDRFGESDGPDFRLQWEFWLFLVSLHSQQLTPIVSEEDGEELASNVERFAESECGKLHLYCAHDEEGEAAKSLCDFFRRGGFEVINSPAEMPGWLKA